MVEFIEVQLEEDILQEIQDIQEEDLGQDQGQGQVQDLDQGQIQDQKEEIEGQGHHHHLPLLQDLQNSFKESFFLHESKNKRKKKINKMEKK